MGAWDHLYLVAMSSRAPWAHVNADGAGMTCRAESNGDREGIALHKLGYLYDKMGEKNRAAMYYKMNLDRMDDESGGRSNPCSTILCSLFHESHPCATKHDDLSYLTPPRHAL